jgi:hypothetical protein
MLLPDKHISFAESLLGLGAFVLENIRVPQDIDALWRAFEKVRDRQFPAHHGFDNLVLAVDMLYAMGALEMAQDGKLMRRSSAPGVKAFPCA